MPNTEPKENELEFFFGGYRLIPARQLLLRGDEPLHIGARALDILMALIEKRGQLASRRELMKSAWPSNVVVDSNLKVHVAALRRLLGEGKNGARYIATVSGRGYRFVAPVYSRLVAIVEAAPSRDAQQPPLTLPLSQLIGRDAATAKVVQMLQQARLVSIVGPGGIGKSAAAQAIADAMRASAGLETCFVNLEAVSSERQLPAAIASALAIPFHFNAGIPALVAGLRGRRLLLTLDSCDHVIDAAAVLCEQVAAQAPGVMMLATSREPLRCAGEHVYRIPALDYAPETASLTAAQALDYSAVQLFTERATSHLQSYRMSDADVPAVMEICRRLDGNALAIGLAATRIEALGARGICALLEDPGLLLHWSQRGILQRHHSLAASLDWSYGLLRQEQQMLLRRLAVFETPFTLQHAIALCLQDGLDTVDLIAGLVGKSLIAADLGEHAVAYRLSETTRAYALEKLAAAGELADMRQRYSELLGPLPAKAVQDEDFATPRYSPIGIGLAVSMPPWMGRLQPPAQTEA